MKAAFSLICLLVEVEAPEFDRVVAVEVAVEVKHSVSCMAVMDRLDRAVVPASGKFFCGPGLSLVDPLQEGRVDCLAVASLAEGSDLDRFGQLVFMAGHEVDQVPDRLRCVAVSSNVDVDSAAPGRATLCAYVAKAPDQVLKELHVFVAKDWGHQFAFFRIGPCDGGVPLEFPLSAGSVPGAPGHVAVAGGCASVVAGSEEGGCCPGRLGAGDVVHLNLNPEGLVLHVFDLDPCRFFHGMCSFRVSVFPCRTVLITLKAHISKLIVR